MATSLCVHRLLLVVSVCTVLVAVARAKTDPVCGTSCVTNNQCPSLQCSHCYHGVCSPGEVCGANCIDDTDCNQASNCTLCTTGTCVQGCGQSCNKTSECQSYGCSYCKNNLCVLLKCGSTCMKDSDCVVAGVEICAMCDKKAYNLPGTCRAGCGTLCRTQKDCPSRCPFCTAGTCGVSPIVEEP